MNSRQRVAGWIAGAVLAAAGLVLGVYLLRGILVFPYLERAAAAFLRSEADLRLTVDKLDGSLIGGLDLAGVRITGTESADTPVTAVLPELRLRYRLTDLWTGLDAFLGGLAIEAVRPDIRIDLSRPAAAPEAGEPAAPFAGLPAALPRLAVADGRLAIEGEGYAGRFEGLSIVPLEAASGSALRLAITVADWQWHLPPLRDGRAGAGMRLAVAPSGMLTIQDLTLNDKVVVAEGRLDLRHLPAVHFTTHSPTTGGHLKVDGRVDDARLQLSVDGREVDLALLGRILADPNLGDLAGRVSLQGDLELPFDLPDRLQGAIDLAAGPGHWQTLDWEAATIQAAAEDGRLRVTKADVAGAGNRVAIRDLAVPTGPLFDGAAMDALSALNAVFEVSLTDIPALWSSFGAPPDGITVPAHRLDLSGSIREGVVAVEEGRLTAAEGSLQVQRLEASLADMAARGADAELTIHATLDWPDLEDLARLLPLPAMSGRLQGAVRLEGPWYAPAGTLRLEGEDLALAGAPMGTLDLTARSDGRWLAMETARLFNGRDRLDLSGRVALESGRFDAVQVALDIADIKRYAEIVPLDVRPLEGKVAADLEIEGALAAPEAAGDIALDDVTLGPVILKQVRGRLETDEEGMQVEHLTLDAPQVNARLSGRIDYPDASTPLIVRLETLTLESREERLALQAPARILRFGDGRWQMEDITLAGSAGRVALTGAVGGEAPTDIVIELAGVSGGAWLAASNGPVRAFDGLEARLRLAGRLPAPEVDVAGRLPRLILRDWPQPLSGRFDIRAGHDGIFIHAWEWAGAAVRLAAEGRLPVRYDGQWRQLPGPLRLEAGLSLEDVTVLAGLFPDFPVARGAGEARVDLGGTLAAPSGSIRWDMRDLYLAADVEGAVRGPFDLQAAGTLHRDGLLLDVLAVDSPLMTLEGRGRWRHEALLTAWMGGSTPGTIEASAALRVPDLGWLAALAPGIQRVTGRLEGRFQVEGPLSRPALTADLELADAGLRPRGDAPPLKNVNATLQANAGRVTIRSFRGEIGGSPFALAGGLQRGGDGVWTIDLSLTGDHLLLYRTADLQVRADTDLRLDGPLEKMRLGGEIGLTGGKLTRYVDFFRVLRPQQPSPGTPREVLFSIPDPPLKDLVFDVAITSREPFRLRNNVVNGGVRPELHLGGTGELPLLTGEIYVDPSRLRLPAGAMQISSGVIRFLASRANRPMLDLLGEGSLFGYDITALIEGPVSEPRVTLSSSPPLPGDQLMLMLLTGQPPAADRPQTDGGIPMNLAVYVGQDLLTQWLGGDTGESWSSVLDRFEVTHGRRVTRSGEETLEAQFRLGEDVLKNGDAIYLTGERDVFDFYNAGLKFVFQFK